MSSKEKKELYGIEIKSLDKKFTGYYMEETKLFTNKIIDQYFNTFPVLEKKEMKKWLCFYERNNYYEPETLSL